MNDHINKGEIEAARAIQYDADRIIYKMCEAHGNLYAVQKEILRRMYGLELGGVREPMPSLIPVSYTHLDVYKRQHPDPRRDHRLGAGERLRL